MLKEMRLGAMFWLFLPILGGLFWLGSGFFTNHQLNQPRPFAGTVEIR